MYHISKDKRAERSAKRIGDGLLLCLQGKSFSDITVTDVQRASSVGRATFYRLFDNISDVLSYLCDSVFEEAGNEFTKAKSIRETTLMFIRKWMDNRELLKAVTDCGRTDIIYGSHIKYLGEKTDIFFPSVNTDTEGYTYLITVMTACTSAFLTAWIKNGSKESAEQLHIRLKECFKILSDTFNTK